ncbi:MAG: GDP-mannose 4,6-dehydratase [Candidatus Nealsonbacteria bacterium]|nr:GDP-mannose 4,6-dehydratase [Candidatus Nealsonbacteria bacterium]
MRTILITGAAGFIGSNLLKLLFNKYPEYHFIVLDALTYAGTLDNIPEEIKKSDRYEFWHGNVCDPAIVNQLAKRADAIVHLAAETHVSRSIFDDSKFFETDVIGTQVISNAVVANKNIERFIHISSSEVYGTSREAPMTEGHPLEPRSPYAAAKAGADRLVRSYMLTYEIPAIILRPFNNYGYNQHLEKVIPRFITSALKNEPLTIHGRGEYLRDWIFVEDTCRAIDRALHADLEKIKFEIINIAYGKDLSNIEIAKMVLENLGKPETLIEYISDRPGQVARHLASTQKAKELLGFQAEIPFKDGLKKTIEWYKNNESWWEKQKDMRLVPIKTKDGKIEMH